MLRFNYTEEWYSNALVAFWHEGIEWLNYSSCRYIDIDTINAYIYIKEAMSIVYITVLFKS